MPGGGGGAGPESNELPLDLLIASHQNGKHFKISIQENIMLVNVYIS